MFPHVDPARLAVNVSQKRIRGHIAIVQLTSYCSISGLSSGLTVYKNSCSQMLLSCSIAVNGDIYRTCIGRYLTSKELSCQVYDHLIKVDQDGNVQYVSGGMIGYRGRRSGVCICVVGVDMGSWSVLKNYYAELRESLCICQCKGSFFCMDMGERGYSVVLFEEFYCDVFKGNFGQMKRLMEGKEFTLDVKCSIPKLVSFNGPIIFVSNEHLYGDERFVT